MYSSKTNLVVMYLFSGPQLYCDLAEKTLMTIKSFVSRLRSCLILVHDKGQIMDQLKKRGFFFCKSPNLYSLFPIKNIKIMNKRSLSLEVSCGGHNHSDVNVYIYIYIYI